VGIALWLVAGTVAFAVARMAPWARTRSWPAELSVSLLAAFLLGVAATALDFGGWQELDWRAALFVFFGALAAVGLLRALRLRRS
jgi:hypothetical protein